MKRSQVRLIRVLLIILLLLLAVFFILSSDRLRSNHFSDGPIPTTEHLPNVTTPDTEPDVGNVSESGPTPTPPTVTDVPIKPADLFDVTGSNPHTTLFQIVRTGSTVSCDQIAYSNYLNGVRALYYDNSSLVFKDNGYYTFAGTDGIPHTYRISDYIDLQELFSGLSSAENGNWFFLGALETRDYIYAAYDFWSVDELTLFFRMDKTGRDVSLVYATQYDELKNSGIFTASNEYIFYIYNTYDAQTGAIEASLMQAESDGSRSGILLPLSDGYSAHHLSLADNALVFMVTNPQGTTSLVRLDTRTQEITYITENCRARDYLYLHKDYAFVGKHKSTLVFYNINTCEEVLIPLGDAASLSLGQFVCNDTQAYLQYFRWNAASATTVLRIDIDAGTASPLVLRKDSLCYVTGITKDSLYAESEGSYLQFPIP